jgi:heme exporter protein A
MASTEPAVVCSGLVRRYGERRALDGLDLTLGKGQTLVVFGPNGAGKTTLLRVLATLLRPSDGDASLLGSDLRKEGWKVRSQIGFLGHQSLCYGDLTARENLRYHAKLHGITDPAARIEALLEQTGLSGRGDERVVGDSRGRLQRLAICRAVLHEPKVLLLDEPRSNLDPAATEQVEPLIGAAPGRTRVIASHDPAGGLAEADLVLGLRDGATILLEPAEQVTTERIGELYR